MWFAKSAWRENIQALKLTTVGSTTRLDPRADSSFVQDCCPSRCVGTLKSTLLNVLNWVSGELHKVPWEKIIKLREVSARLWCKGGQVECEGKRVPMQVRVHVR